LDSKELRTWLLANVFSKSDRICSQILKKHKEVEQTLLALTFFVDSVPLSTRVHAFLNGQTSLTRCLYGDKEIQPNKRGVQ
jgi:hypothetical protein